MRSKSSVLIGWWRASGAAVAAIDRVHATAPTIARSAAALPLHRKRRALTIFTVATPSLCCGDSAENRTTALPPQARAEKNNCNSVPPGPGDHEEMLEFVVRADGIEPPTFAL